MASCRGLKLVALVAAVTCMAAAGVRGEASVTCGQVVRYVMPCVGYVANGGAVTEACCAGIKTLNGVAKTAEDRQGVCSCLKQAVGGFSYGARNVGLAAGLPAKCGLNLPYKISPTTDCKSVN